ncbi:MAG: IS5 family transposase [Alphaproteobacteria bacterium]|nr:MAG: IS5 family transposase [Alphaproteobacteria bacterium]
MIRYKPSNQIKIEEFKTPFEIKLDKSNRWVKMSELIPWDKLASIYYKGLSEDEGCPSIDARRIIGAMLIKHKLNLSDEESVLQIMENPYMQFFLGYDQYEGDPIFTPTLFVEIRKRLGLEEFNKMTDLIIDLAYSSQETKSVKKNKKDKGQESTCETSIKPEQSEQEKSQDRAATVEVRGGEEIKNHGRMIIDASVANQAIKYPTDLELLNDSREISEKLIDGMYKKGMTTKKPRTYRRKARKEFLVIAKKKKKTRMEIRKAMRKQLGYVGRNLKSIEKMLGKSIDQKFPLSKKEQKQLWVISEIYRQQKEMYDSREHSCDARIVSISQPHVRPIVRGKQGKEVEFGAKIGVSLRNGFAKVDHLSWEAYNESKDLPTQVENFKKTYGSYPEVILADTIYGTKENREFMKIKGIRFAGKPLGRPKKQTEDNKKELASERQRRKKEYLERIPIEGKFGQGKNGYRLNYIRAKLPKTSESWIGCIFFVMSIVNLMNKEGKKINSILNTQILALKFYFQQIFATQNLSYSIL